MSQSPDSLQYLLFGLASIVVLYHAWRGWRLGVIRQGIRILALLGAYTSAYVCGPWLVPFLRPLGLPDQLLRVLGGVALGVAVFVSVLLISAIIFKKTSDQSVGVVRWGYGALGAMLGAGFSLFTIWTALVGIRLLGAVAQSEVVVSKKAGGQSGGHTARPGSGRGTEVMQAVVGGLAQLKGALESGTAGSVLGHVDPVPGNVYSNLSKITELTSSRDGIERFKTYPGVRALALHPKILALQQDPAIAKAVESRDILKMLELMHNEHLVKAANDPEVAALLHKFDLDKALTYSLGKAGDDN